MRFFVKTYKLYRNIKESKMKKRILSLIFLILLFSSTLSQAFGEIDDGFFLEDLVIKVEAPDEVKYNEEVKVMLTIAPLEEIYIESLTITFFPFYEETLFYQQNISGDFSKTYILKIATDSSFRLPCKIKISYITHKGTLFESRYEEQIFLDLTYITSQTREELEYAYQNYTLLKSNYEELESDYKEVTNKYETLSKKYGDLDYNYSLLKTDYNRLKKDYEDLESKYEDLKNEYGALNVDYLLLSENYQKLVVMAIILVLTTIIFSASTIYLMLKRKQQGKQKSK